MESGEIKMSISKVSSTTRSISELGATIYELNQNWQSATMDEQKNIKSWVHDCTAGDSNQGM